VTRCSLTTRRNLSAYKSWRRSVGAVEGSSPHLEFKLSVRSTCWLSRALSVRTCHRTRFKRQHFTEILSKTETWWCREMLRYNDSWRIPLTWPANFVMNKFTSAQSFWTLKRTTQEASVFWQAIDIHAPVVCSKGVARANQYSGLCCNNDTRGGLWPQFWDVKWKRKQFYV
jgi:hypothetical protein